MKKLQMIHDGKAKRVFATDDPGRVLISFKDEATAYGGLKRGTILGKGIINNRVSNFLMKMLERNGIPTHFIEEISDRETIVRRVEMIPVAVVVRNRAAGSLSQRLGIPEGAKLRTTVLEFSYLNDELENPVVNEDVILAMGWTTKAVLDQMSAYALRINELLRAHMRSVDVELVDFMLEFGLTREGKVILADEISPDTCRFWDMKTGERMDIDRFRRDLGGVEDAYAELRRRLMGT